ncbi:MAG: Gfo/Idh/MocA family oxidoreductase [Bdellovibrio sp.]
MSNHLNKNVTLVGLGQMAVEYTKVLKDLHVEIVPIGRSAGSCDKYTQTTGIKSYQGGVQKNAAYVSPYAIVSTNVESLYETSLELIQAGAKHILIEKPGALTTEDLGKLKMHADSSGAKVYIAYNRRFLDSVVELKKRIALDGGIQSCFFEFTEWSHVIDKLPDSPAKQTTFISNSTHVVDLAFHLIGSPKKMTCYKDGENLFNWNSGPSRFTGSGVSEKNVLFCYHANWTSAGRWGIEILTKNARYYLRPLEKLSRQTTGTLQIEEINLLATAPSDLKPGLKLMVQDFLQDTPSADLQTLSQQIEAFKVYSEINN